MAMHIHTKRAWQCIYTQKEHGNAYTHTNNMAIHIHTQKTWQCIYTHTCTHSWSFLDRISLDHTIGPYNPKSMACMYRYTHMCTHALFIVLYWSHFVIQIHTYTQTYAHILPEAICVRKSLRSYTHTHTHSRACARTHTRTDLTRCYGCAQNSMVLSRSVILGLRRISCDG